MSSDSKKRSLKDALPRGEQFPSKAEPTRSLLDCDAWVEEIKRQSRIHLPEHEQMLGPFFREDAPYRAKISPPYEKGSTIVIRGHVWSYDLKSGVPATMDVWQADEKGRYDNEGSSRSTNETSFRNRARVRCDEHGYYEIETIHPGSYERGTTRHASHIHFRVAYPAHIDCVTQLLFKGDPYVDVDPFRDYSVIMELTNVVRNGQEYKEGVFDVVLKLMPEGATSDSN